MAYRRITWTVDDLYVLSQYPRKTCKELALELHVHRTTVANKLREQGRTLEKRGRRRKESPCA